MPIPRPKFLPCITVGSGWQLVWRTSTSPGGYETLETITLTAGDYFMAWDGQSDDLIFHIATLMQANAPADTKVLIDITSTHKVRFSFEGSAMADANTRDVKLQWTLTTATLAKILGFDTSADDTSSGNYQQFTADYHHGYGWYADEDGLLFDYMPEDENIVEAVQNVALSGKISTQKLAQKFRNKIQLKWLPVEKTFSQNCSYGATPTQGSSRTAYVRNAALECWWNACHNGTRFRFYADNQIDTSKASDVGVETSSNTTTLTNSNKNMTIEPQIYKGRLLYIDDYSANLTIPQRFYISSHTATVLTISNAHPAGYNLGAHNTSYFIFDQPYQTYIIDLEDMKSFLPTQVNDGLERYDIEIPVLRYVA